MGSLRCTLKLQIGIDAQKTLSFDFQCARTMPAWALDQYTLVYGLVDQFCVEPVTGSAL